MLLHDFTMGTSVVCWRNGGWEMGGDGAVCEAMEEARYSHGNG